LCLEDLVYVVFGGSDLQVENSFELGFTFSFSLLNLMCGSYDYSSAEDGSMGLLVSEDSRKRQVISQRLSKPRVILPLYCSLLFTF
jgi:hypothetical protein